MTKRSVVQRFNFTHGTAPQPDDLDSLTSLEFLGVVSRNGEGYRVCARLLLDWLRANVD